ncbi:MAG: hypothetical protein ABJ308_15810 [Halieaceae bacterium]
MDHQTPLWFTGLKYIVYALLLANVFFFLQEEMRALEHTFSDGFTAGDIIQAFAATIDTGAWVILLLLFELETSVLPDELIKGRVKWGLHGIRAICYVFIVYAFYGYVVELQMLYKVAPLATVDACTLLGEDWSLLVTIDEYLLLGTANCIEVGTELWQVGGFNIVADSAVLQDVQWLAWTDVFNAAAWILVVLVLEFDVRLQLRGGINLRLMRTNLVVKGFLYSVLLGAAVYWWFEGDFLDFWDAFLWLFAFVFIESNLFAWQAETLEQNLEIAEH